METETFQHYQVLRRADGSLWELGRGAMAVTYKAIDSNLRCPVALKVVSAANLDDQHTRARFVREARAAAGLRHRNIASVHHLGNDEQSYFYAMEFIDGETVEDRVIRLGPLPPAEALGIAAQVARALGAAAKQGLVHRDIKPANVMVVRDDDDEALIVKVIDFGLARRAVVNDQSARITVSGFVGTPQYASPEQIAERDLDSRSDIYSLGVTLWYMLTGQPTFSGSVVRISSQQLNDEPPWAAVASLAEPVRALLARMLRKNPAERPQDPSILRREIETCLTGMAPAASAGIAPTPGASASGQSDATIHPKPVTASTAEVANDEASSAREPDIIPQGPAPVAGDILSDRFRLLESVGVGRTGQVFRAVDTKRGDCPVAVKVIGPDLGLGGAEIHHLRDEIRRLRGAPHPCLIEVFALDQTRGHWFRASEWIDGFTLVDLLRHRGRLEPAEAFRLLECASDAAAHGTANGLHRLELGPQQVLVHFAVGFAGDRVHAIEALVDRPMAQWPEFELKIDAAAPARELGRTPTWMGEMTLVPTSRPSGYGLQPGSRQLLQGNYFYALGCLLYELLNGTPPPENPDAGNGTPPLSMLSEGANDILQRALSANPGFRGEKEFFDDLLTASGMDRDDLQFQPGPAVKGSPYRPTTDATVVPSFEPPVVAAVKRPTQVPEGLPMAPTIRTKLLRSRNAPARQGTSLPVGGRPSHRVQWMITAGVAGLIAVAAVGIYFLLLKPSSHTPPRPAPAEMSASSEDATLPADDSAAPGTATDASPAASRAR